MPRKERKDRQTSSRSGDNPGDARRPHSIRFSDSEWTKIEDAAVRHGISAGELVRSGALAAAGDRLAMLPSAAISSGHLALIEATWRTVYVLATLNREELLGTGREQELDEIIAAAHEVMAETMEAGPA